MPRLYEGIIPQFTKTAYDKCMSVGIDTVTDFILIDPEELAKSTKLPYKDVLTIHRNLVTNFTSFPQNASSLQKELQESLSILNTGSKRLDKFLSGGIYTGEVTEICGKPVSGKTQFCLSLVANLISTPKSTVMYFVTFENFRAKRLQEILMEKGVSEKIAVQMLENVKVKFIYNIYELFDYLDIIHKELEKNQEHSFFKYLKLIVIDSMTPLLSVSFGEKHVDGYFMFDNLAQFLHVLCTEYNISIFVCNNITQDKNLTLKPALGLNWKYIPSVTLTITKIPESQYRKIKAVKSCRNGTSKEVTVCISKVGITDSDLPVTLNLKNTTTNKLFCSD